jgi:uncharacterized protein YkwD
MDRWLRRKIDMKRYCATLIIAVLVISSFCVTAYAQVSKDSKKKAFTEDMYAKLDWKAFYQIPEVNQKMDLINPDYDLLNAAIFYVTNEEREKAGKGPLKYSYQLRNAAVLHSEKMLELKFFSHNNTKDTTFFNPTKRIERSGGNFVFTGENITRLSVMNYTKEKFKTYKQDDLYKYFAPNGKIEIETLTYLNFAKNVVSDLLKSEDNKANMIFNQFEFLGCGAVVIPNPYRTRKLPVAYVTQNFGGYKKQ